MKTGTVKIAARITEWIANIFLFIIISLLYYIGQPVHTEKNIYIKPGSISAIITQFRKDGYDLGPLDKQLLRLVGAPQSGWIYMGKNRLNRIEFLYRLGSAKSAFKKITLIPGETTVIFLKNLAKSLDLNETKLMDEYSRLSKYKEGGILAETYNIPLHYKEKRVIDYLLNLSEKRYEKLSIKYSDRYDPSEWNKILTIASIIQKEAANTEEMPLVSSVIYNRLKKNMRLQMDGTLNYGIYSHERVTPERIKNDNSTYNTYKHRGLPEYPVCNVSIKALEAAIDPARTDYLYFVKNSNGNHDFSKTYKRHLRHIRDKKRDSKTSKQ